MLIKVLFVTVLLQFKLRVATAVHPRRVMLYGIFCYAGNNLLAVLIAKTKLASEMAVIYHNI